MQQSLSVGHLPDWALTDTESPAALVNHAFDAGMLVLVDTYVRAGIDKVLYCTGIVDCRSADIVGGRNAT